MRLSLHILANWLKHYNPSIYCQNTNLELENVRLYNRQTKLISNTVYVGIEQDFLNYHGQKVMCKYQADYIILDTYDKECILNEILDAFQTYSTWIQTLKTSAEAKCTLTELLDISSFIIKNPLFVLDSSDYLIAISDQYQNMDIDPTWKVFLENKSSPPDNIMAFHNKDNVFFNNQNRTPYFLPKGLFPRNNYSLNLFSGNERCGIFVMIEYDTLFTQGCVDEFEILGRAIQEWIDKNFSENLFSMSQSLFKDILDGETEKISILKRKLLSNNWHDDDEKLLLKATVLSQSYNTDAYLCKVFSSHSKFIHAFLINKSIVLICNIHRLKQKELFIFLSQWFKRANYSCGTSLMFKTLQNLNEQYKQASIALDYGKKDSGTINSIGDTAFAYITHIIKKNISSEILHPALKEILNYDKCHNSNYYITLQCYLKNERNRMLTSKELNIHRNTLSYRILRFSEYFHLNLDDANERFYLLISFQMLS